MTVRDLLGITVEFLVTFGLLPVLLIAGLLIVSAAGAPR